MPLLRAIYHSIRLSERIPIRVFPTVADACLASYPSFKSTDSYRHVFAVSHIPFEPSPRADSNELHPYLIWLPAGNLASPVNQASLDVFLFSFFNTSLYILWLFSLQYMPFYLRVVSIAYNSLFLYVSALQLLTCIPVCLQTLKSYCVTAIFTQSSEDIQITCKNSTRTVRCRCCGVQWYSLSLDASSQLPMAPRCIMFLVGGTDCAQTRLVTTQTKRVCDPPSRIEICVLGAPGAQRTRCTRHKH